MHVCPHCHLILADSEETCPHDGEASQEAEPAPLPAVLHERFTDIETFAHGNTGTSYRALQSSSSYAGLLKVVPVSALDASERARVKRELRKQTKLTNNSLVRIIDGGEVDAELWLFRDFVEGESLAQRIRRLGKIELSEALSTAAQIATALDELHRNGLLHRDVKPGHVILKLRPEGVPLVKLTDAGIAARIESGAVFDLVGTPAYMSPEQASGKLVSFRSDLYALGCVLFEMLTGAPPFRGDNDAVLEAHKNQEPPSLEDAYEEGAEALPAAVVNLVGALLQKEPRKRPFSAQQVRRTLDPLLPESTPAARSASTTSAGVVHAPPSGRAGAPPPPPSGGGASFVREDDTEEIDLVEVDAVEAEAGRETLQLQVEDLAELDAEAFSEPRSTVDLNADDLAELAVAEGATDVLEGIQAAAGKAASASEGEDGAPPAPQGGELSDETADPAEQGEAEAQSAKAAGEDGSTEGETAAARAQDPGRPSVDFDVESLFDDDVPTDQGDPQEGLDEAAPTQIYRPDSGENLPTALYKPGTTDAKTVVTARPESRDGGPPWGRIAIGALLLVGLFMIFSGDDEDETAESPSAGDGAGAQAEAAGVAGAEQAAGAADEQPKAVDPAPSTGAAAGEAPPAAAAQAGAEEQEPTEDALEESGEEGDEAAAEAAAAADGSEGSEPSEASEASSAADEAKADAKPEPASGSAKVERQAKPDDKRASVPRGSAAERKAEAAAAKEKARAAYRAGKYRDAAKQYETATRLTPSDAGAFAGLGASRLAEGDAKAAITAYQRAVRLQPKSSGFQAALGRAYVQKGDTARGRKAYERALELNPKNSVAKAALDRL